MSRQHVSASGGSWLGALLCLATLFGLWFWSNGATPQDAVRDGLIYGCATQGSCLFVALALFALFATGGRR